MSPLRAVLVLGVFGCLCVLPVLAQAAPPNATVTSSATTGKHFGIAVVHMDFAAADRPRLQPDQTLQFVGDNQRVLYPAFHARIDEPADSPADKPVDRRLQALDAYFLFAGNDPPKIGVAIDSEILLEPIQPAVDVAGQQNKLLDKWWAAYQQPSAVNINEHEAYVRNYLQGMLARRLGLTESQAIKVEHDESQLESYFEKATVMMFGFASVNSAIGDSSWSTYSVGHGERATASIPRAIELPSVQVPHFQSVAVEQLAMHVPADCMYVRCRNVDNYLWFRKFLMDWGGNLQQVVAERTYDGGVRKRVETQLALNSNEEGQKVLRENVEDLALVASDPYFEDGAGIGVLFQAHNSKALKNWVHACRQQVAEELQATETTVDLNGHSVALLSTEDQRVRSFLAIDGPFVLVTNSSSIAERFLTLSSRPASSLGATTEFRYARLQCPVNQDQTAFLYLSDPFFRRLASPTFRIELSRRQRAVHELRYLALARLAANAEGVASENVDELIASGYLPPGFGRRADETEPKIVQGDVRDSKRGAIGTFTPIVDMPVVGATQSEVAEFRDFAARYRGEWRATDPVVVRLSHESADNNREHVHINIKITPYARGSYAELTQHLVSNSTKKIVPPDTDLLSLGGQLQRQEGGAFLLYAGLQDANVDFSVHDGQVQILSPEEKKSFASAYSYLAFRDGSMRDLLAVRDLLVELGLGNSTGGGGAFLNVVDSMFQLSNLNPGNLVRTFLGFGGFGSARPPSPLGLDIVSRDWRVISHTEGVGDPARKGLQLADTKSQAQLRLKMRDVAGAKVEPYLRAYSYLEARKASSANTHLLSIAAQQFHMRSEAPSKLANVLGCQLHCPLGGEFQYADNDSAPGHWTSTSWAQRSLYDESQAADNYQFPFLNWLHGLELEFRLDPNTLHADVDLIIEPK